MNSFITGYIKGALLANALGTIMFLTAYTITGKSIFYWMALAITAKVFFFWWAAEFDRKYNEERP